MFNSIDAARSPDRGSGIIAQLFSNRAGYRLTLPPPALHAALGSNRCQNSGTLQGHACWGSPWLPGEV